ncbi:type II toxin-antitoxin system Phd/YefM family antitoxin [Streptomyces sp. MNU89]|uniref:type II toxin-antitoxin system Phd/YefM family antitoxin n=1 Tax=Streptomyces sp. MNU89 TaxID=2560025 RepID=UPI001E29BF9C|nr:type II toxin-antitoxin system prevent-host-death family antitoxin [Streptomyces sp. MNU89]MCC9741738.1 type II toxin-antitoxin system prevent-host-death family antitoxin [Streptomyces sp. MNU89]
MESTAREFNRKCSQILAAAARGETVTVTKNGTPISKGELRPGMRIPGELDLAAFWRSEDDGRPCGNGNRGNADS